MSFEVWYGTPAEMARGSVQGTQTAAVKWARDYLSGMEKTAGKFDHRAFENIRSTKEQLLQTIPIRTGDMRSWEFGYLSVTFRLEIRST